MKSKKILVVGGAGYVGTVLVSRLLQNGNAVTVLDLLLKDNLYYSNETKNHKNLTFISGDLNDVNLLIDIMKSY